MILHTLPDGTVIVLNHVTHVDVPVKDELNYCCVVHLATSLAFIQGTQREVSIARNALLDHMRNV